MLVFMSSTWMTIKKNPIVLLMLARMTATDIYFTAHLLRGLKIHFTRASTQVSVPMFCVVNFHARLALFSEQTVSSCVIWISVTKFQTFLSVLIT